MAQRRNGAKAQRHRGTEGEAVNKNKWWVMEENKRD